MSSSFLPGAASCRGKGRSKQEKTVSCYCTAKNSFPWNFPEWWPQRKPWSLGLGSEGEPSAVSALSVWLKNKNAPEKKDAKFTMGLIHGLKNYVKSISATAIQWTAHSVPENSFFKFFFLHTLVMAQRRCPWSALVSKSSDKGKYSQRISAVRLSKSPMLTFALPILPSIFFAPNPIYLGNCEKLSKQLRFHPSWTTKNQFFYSI